MSASATRNLPDWDDIPPVKGMPHGCAWAVWGEGDQLGALNLLTPENTLAAMKEAQLGIRFQLDWPMNTPKYPSPRRIPIEQKLIPSAWLSCDDELHFNTQSSSQWDGFKHIAHPPTKLFYGGLPWDDVVSGKEPLRNGIHNWVASGGIAGRGVLLDWVRWHTLTKPDQVLPQALSSHAIPVSELDEVAKFQGTEFKVGDVLFLRTGFVKWYNEANDAERKRGMQENDSQFIGVVPGDVSKKWIWNHHFAAVVGDNLAFEKCPIDDVTIALHQWLLPQAGIPIGEMFNLENLSEACERHKKWSFFFTSAPLNVPGGVASSPNIIAIL